MKAMVLEGVADVETAPLKLRDVADPQPAAGEVRVRVRACAVCRTDLHVIEGELPAKRLPLIPGHQVVGVVDRLGAGCQELRVGQRVGIAWLRHTCGQCRFCRADRENLCPASRYTGYHADGGYAELAVVPERFAYPLADGLGDDVAAAPLLCAGIVGYRALRRADLPPGGRLAIFGFGSSAHVIAQIVLARGGQVYVVTRAAAHQELARRLGAAWAGGDAADLPTKVDSAIIFAPAGSLVPAALASLENGGTLSLAGIHMTAIPPLDYHKHLFGERTIRSITSNTRQNGVEFLAAAAQCRIRPQTSTYPLADANRALADLKADRISGTGVLLIG